MKKKLLTLGLGSLLARFFVYSLSLFLMGMVPNIFSVPDEIWSNIDFYVSQGGCLLLSFFTVIIFMLLGAKGKCERKLFFFSSVAGITLGGGVNHILGAINSMLIAATQRYELEYIGMRLIMVAECVGAAVFAVLIFKALSEKKETESKKDSKKLITVGAGTLLARFSALSLFLLLLGIVPHSFAITSKWTEIWSNIWSYVIELGCLALSLVIIILLTLIAQKDKCERKLFAFSSLVGVAFGGAVYNWLNFPLSIYTSVSDNLDFRSTAMQVITVVECLAAASVAMLIFKTFHKEKKD